MNTKTDNLVIMITKNSGKVIVTTIIPIITPIDEKIKKEEAEYFANFKL